MQKSPSGTALLVIDMQEAVLRGCHEVAGVTGRINDLVQRARAAGAPVVFVQHQDASDAEMVAGSPGWQLSTALDRLDDDLVIPKTYRDSFADTGLDEVLQAAGARRVIVTGAHSDFCIQTTALSAIVRGYDLTLAADAHTSISAPLPDGELAAATVVAFVNRRMSTLRHPGRRVEVEPAADVSI